MWQPTTFAPEGGVPADCTDAWSEEQVLIEPYTQLFWHTREGTAMRWNRTGLRAEAATRLTTAVETAWLAEGESPVLVSPPTKYLSEKYPSERTRT
jgi:hypothetical protein